MNIESIGNKENEFRQKCLDAGVALGTLKKTDKENEFRQKYLDADVALETLKKTADGTYQSLMAKADSFTKTISA